MQRKARLSFSFRFTLDLLHEEGATSVYFICRLAIFARSHTPTTWPRWRSKRLSAALTAMISGDTRKAAQYRPTKTFDVDVAEKYGDDADYHILLTYGARSMQREKASHVYAGWRAKISVFLRFTPPVHWRNTAGDCSLHQYLPSTDTRCASSSGQ